MNIQAAPTRQTDLAAEFAAIAELLCRCTVQIKSDRTGFGSGIIWHPDGLVITNAHVASRPDATVKLWDGRVFEAAVTARDSVRDLAALTLKATDLPAATIGDSSVLRVGELVLAVGNPLGLVGALTTGIISRLGFVETPKRQEWVMADVRLSPGNSGGPLADAQGRVIGVNSMIVGGLALAVPSHAVKRFLLISGAEAV
ncbi:MAG: trypsin-like peptidase domain-containing protein [Chroococcidiopsidaceae cyanobacterium CP_BM_ER_R8_30]|nr:trypsin-like peptidase domain-containing protein [Chroococcidiopsidaceae cyanobacterium CP_BM_ER_R8_30]